MTIGPKSVIIIHRQQKGVKMQYTLITKTGKVMQFYIKAVADTYQQGLGGVVFGPQVLETQEIVQKTVAL